jgi:nuclear pore complex protein Nup205
MSELGDLERLETLHRDLLALAELRLLNVERLWIQLEARIADFRRLLDKASRNEQSRKALATGMYRKQSTS